MSNETQAEKIERLETLNHKLSAQIIAQSDRLQDSALQIAAEAWDALLDKLDDDDATIDPAANSYPNPYRAMIAEKEAAK